MNDIKVVLPAVSEDVVSNSLRDLTQILEEHTGSDNVQGILGGRHGYGVEFKNEVFEMHPFYWGDCVCNYEEKEHTFYEDMKHEDHCYQIETRDRLRAEGFKVTDDGWLDDDDDEVYDRELNEKFHVRKSAISSEVAKKYGLPEIGLYVHCTCSYQEKSNAWHKANDHSEECPIIWPNFHHFASGLEISWYKYIGRGMEVNKDVNLQEWTTIFIECVNSLNNEAEPSG